MVKNNVGEWDTNADNNTDVGGINIAEGMPAASVNNAMREMMAQTREFWNRQIATVETFSAAYTAVLTDRSKLLRFTDTATLTLTAAATLTDGWYVFVSATGGTVTIDPNAAETIDGATTLAVATGDSVLVFCNGSTFYTLNFRITPGSVGTSELADGSVTGAKIPSSAITATHLAANSVGSSEIAASAVGLSELSSAAETELKENDVSTTTSSSEISFVIGHHIGCTSVATSGSANPRNSTVSPRLHTSFANEYNLAGSGLFLSGTWRQRGKSGDSEFAILQRIS